MDILNRTVLHLFLSVFFLISGYGVAISQEISDEARRYFDRGMAAVEMASGQADYKIAADEFKQAASLAPDWPEAYYNLGLVQEKAGLFRDAAESLKAYIKLNPSASDAETIKSYINKLEFKAEQTLSISDIIDILVSTDFYGARQNKGEWRYSATLKTDGRECQWSQYDDSLGELTFSRAGDDSVKVMKDMRLYPAKISYQVLRVEGPVLKYLTTVNMCDETANRLLGNCDWVKEYEIEVMSKRLIKVNQKVLTGGGQSGTSHDGDSYSCTFSR